MPLRILIYSINFAPELTGIGKYTGEMAEWLAGRGHEVRVVTAPPFSPEWRISRPYSGWRYRRERNARLQVFRCPVWIPPKTTGFARVLHLMSFALSSLPVMLGQIFWRPDLVWAVEPTCLCFPTALLVARASGAKSWAHVQDFEIDAAFEMRLLPRAPQPWVLSAEKFLLSSFDRVSTISDNMVARLMQKGMEASRCRLFPNWVDTTAIFPQTGPSLFRAKLGIPSDAVVPLYSGNMANKQGLDVLMEAVCQLAGRPGLHFVLSGDGPARGMVVERMRSLPNVHVLPLQPYEQLNDLLNLADIHLLPQRADAADLVMPSKLTGMLASGRPILATARPGTEVARVVQGCGLVVPPGDPNAIVAGITALCEQPRLRRQFGQSARDYAVSHLHSSAVLGEFDQAMVELCDRRSVKQEPAVAAQR